ncbi:MAG TPA: hypothetical protein VF753_02460 [Terriglobales bacterium]
MTTKLTRIAFVFLLTLSTLSLGQTLQSLKHQPPDGAGIGYLLTDGTVMFQGGQCSDWWKLTPDNTGSYVNGTWSQLESLPNGYDPLYFAGAVLADGRVVIMGGEYSGCGQSFSLTNQGAIYNPATNKWSTMTHPKDWGNIGDSPSVVLPDGTYMLGDKLTKEAAALDPKTLEWTVVPTTGKRDFNAEEGWTLLPDGTFVTYDVRAAPHAERYIPSQSEWITAGSTIVDLHSPHPGGGCIPYPGGCYKAPGEVGPGMLLPDGKVFATGSYTGNNGAGHTAIYTPPSTLTGEGKWVVGPDFPNSDNAGDSFAVLLPSGVELIEADSGTLYDWNGTTLTQDPVSGGYAPILVLPNGQVFMSGFNASVYTPKGTYQASWAPKITAHPKTVTPGSTYKISGQQFNGLSQAASFGDEDETATNYPLVRITNTATGHVFYAKTHDHSTMGVATGTATVYTYFDVPSGIETGASTLVVVANGIPSKSVSITVQ